MNTFAQGEVYARRIDALPDNLEPFAEKTDRDEWIISHSESGNHHVISSDGVTVMEKTRDVPTGLKILYAIVKNPSSLRQDAGAGAHEAHDLEPGIYEMRIAREYDPFTEQARRVAD